MSKHHRDTSDSYLKSYGSSQDECYANFPAKLQKLQPAISNVKKDMGLAIKLQNRQLMVYNKTQLCGYLIDPKSLKLIDCINNGHEYVAVVTSVSPNSCEVTVQNA